MFVIIKNNKSTLLYYLEKKNGSKEKRKIYFDEKINNPRIGFNIKSRLY